MKTNLQSFLTRRVILAVVAGVIASILLIAYLPNDMLAAILGSMVTLIVAPQRRPIEIARVGLFTGALSGLYWGAASFLTTGGANLGLSQDSWPLSVLGGLVLVGLLCALYGFLTGKFIQLYQKGRGPFF